MTFGRLIALGKPASEPTPQRAPVRRTMPLNEYRNYEQIFMLGQSAFRSGVAMQDGPFELAADHSHYDAWVDGWQHAQASAQLRSVWRND